MANTKRTAQPTLSNDTFTRLAEIAERSRQLAKEAEELQQRIALEQNVRLARGTKRNVMQVTPPNGVPVKADVSTTPLYQQMLDMLSKRPYTLRELIAATKGEENKVKVALMRMQRDEIGLENMGNQFRALWYIPSQSFRERMKR
jgi:23S rRNA G2445 N2-methylase RlmL